MSPAASPLLPSQPASKLPGWSIGLYITSALACHFCFHPPPQSCCVLPPAAALTLQGLLMCHASPTVISIITILWCNSSMLCPYQLFSNFRPRFKVSGFANFPPHREQVGRFFLYWWSWPRKSLTCLWGRGASTRWQSVANSQSCSRLTGYVIIMPLAMHSTGITSRVINNDITRLPANFYCLAKILVYMVWNKHIIHLGPIFLLLYTCLQPSF